MRCGEQVGASLAADQEEKASEHWSFWPLTHLQLGGGAAQSGRVGSGQIIPPHPHFTHTAAREQARLGPCWSQLPGLLIFHFSFFQTVLGASGSLFFFLSFSSTGSPQGHLAIWCKACRANSGRQLKAAYVQWLISWSATCSPHLTCGRSVGSMLLLLGALHADLLPLCDGCWGGGGIAKNLEAASSSGHHRLCFYLLLCGSCHSLLCCLSITSREWIVWDWTWCQICFIFYMFTLWPLIFYSLRNSDKRTHQPSASAPVDIFTCCLTSCSAPELRQLKGNL